jgi:hypothetical protein
MAFVEDSIVMENHINKTTGRSFEIRIICKLIGCICIGFGLFPTAIAGALEETYLKGTNTITGDHFGWDEACAISDNTNTLVRSRS